jgi:hypothetical protein
MAHERPTDDLRGTEPARQVDDGGLSDRAAPSPAGPTSPIRDSRPGVVFAVVLLVLFLVVLVAAVALGVIR